MRSKIVKFIYWTAVATLTGLILSSCYWNQQMVQSYRQVLPLVVTISSNRNDDLNPETYSLGTGFFISEKYVLTVHHVVKSIEEDALEIQLWDGHIISAKEIAVDKFNDLALLQINPEDIESYKIPILDLWTNSQVGETVFVVGSPNGFPGTLTKGIFSRGTTKEDHPEWYWKCEVYLVDAICESGHSGSPVYDTKHRIVGIVSGYFGSFSVAIPSYSIRAFLKEHKAI